MRILVVDDDETLRLTIRYVLEEKGHDIEEACDGVVAVEKIRQKPNSYDAIFLDVNMPRKNGIEALQEIQQISPQIFCIVLTAHSDVKDAVSVMKAGAYDYLEKPIEIPTLLSLLEAATRANALVEAAAFSAPQIEFAKGRTIIGSSSKIRRVFEIIQKLSKVETAVLIRGESGTGKELVARALHCNSNRRKGPFIAVNCAAIPDNLIESELFGYERGAFTGADRKKIGKFAFAEGGTLFLDEIGDISLSMQVKLLRVLQEKVFTPIGSNAEIDADVRIVAASNQSFEQMISKGDFREDLFYRLNILPILLPSLRDRREDIPSLIQFMINKFNKSHSRQIKDLEPKALQALRVYDWPGNIRELENVIEHAFILENDPQTLYHSSLPEKLQNFDSSSHLPHPQEICDKIEPMADVEEHSDLNYPILKEKFEREFIIKALKTFYGRINKTAAHTKMTKVTLLRKMEKYQINPKEYRNS